MSKTIREKILEKVAELRKADEKERGRAAEISPPKPPKIMEIERFLNLHGRGFGCQEVTVRGLLEVILDQPKDTFRREEEEVVPLYPIGAIVVPLDNPNCHNYTLNVPVMVWFGDSGSKGLRRDGTIGNYLPSRSGHPISTRFATPEEAKEFLDDLSRVTLKAVSEKLL